MKKRITVILATLLCSLLLTGVAFAGPLTDYAKGKTAVDISLMPKLDGEAASGPGTLTLDGKNSNIDWSVTTGLGGKFALQYRQFNPESKTYPWGYGGLDTQELNVLYRLDKGLSAFAGLHRAKISSPFNGSTQNALQLGLLGTTPLGPKFQLYGVVGFGKNLFNGEAGIAYQLAKNTDLNLFYRYKKVDGLEPYDVDATLKGPGVGLTYRF